jgi:hypothetical protein
MKGMKNFLEFIIVEGEFIPNSFPKGNQKCKTPGEGWKATRFE